MLANLVTDANIIGVARRSYKTVLFKPNILCISNQLKYLPVRCIPIVIGLSLVDDLLGRIVSNVAFANEGFTVVNTSITWQIQNVQAKCDLVALDSGLRESYIKLVEEEGKN